jgi:pimeloyl-ACP methyl ester carboxylesterase
MSTLPIVLVHGGGLDGRCWDPLVPHLPGPSLAVDLPGRGAHPMPLREVDFAACAQAVAADVDAAGFDELVLVGHSLAGCSMPATMALLGERVRHAVFVACTVPDDGRSAFDMLDPSIQEMIRAAGDAEPRPMDAATARLVLGDDLTDEQFAWCSERLVAEAPGLTTDPVDLAPLRSFVLCIWVRTLGDIVVSADRQLAYAANVGGVDGDCPVVDIDCGHMCMVSRPADLARILTEVATT